VNWLFDTWDVESIVAALDYVTYHFHRMNRGQEETRTFLNEVYPYLIRQIEQIKTNLRHVFCRGILKFFISYYVKKSGEVLLIFYVSNIKRGLLSSFNIVYLEN